jgi:transcriptional regulator with GAF, ATPase, and Fis domain
MDLSSTSAIDYHSVIDHEESSNDPISVLKNNQLSALESLASLLLREVELLKEQEERVTRSINSEKGVDLYKEVQNFEAKMIRSALIQARGVQRKAAELLGLKVTTLNVKIKRYKITFDRKSAGR